MNTSATAPVSAFAKTRQGTVSMEQLAETIARDPNQPDTARPGTPDPTWHDIIATLRDAEDMDLMNIMSSILNTKLDAMQKFEGRARFMAHDIRDAYIGMRYFVNFKKLNETIQR